ncbi:MAG: hypothetical protein ABGX04_04635 [Myxococcales bacterium]|nr:hypothetical protein [Myxococcales bacterium]HIK83771.1 hypothetical protein [Myxococcales bacterium]
MSPVFAVFRWQALAALVLWGQLSELLAEAVSVLNQGWVYRGQHAGNPVLFHVPGHPITVIP